MARIERTELDLRPEGQWVDIHRSPTVGQLTQFESLTRAGARGDAPGVASDRAGVRTFVADWHVLDADGAPIPFAAGEFDRLPVATWSLIVDEVSAMLDAQRPAGGLAAALRALRALADTVPSASERLREIEDELAALAGATRPNPATQAGP